MQLYFGLWQNINEAGQFHGISKIPHTAKYGELSAVTNLVYKERRDWAKV